MASTVSTSHRRKEPRQKTSIQMWLFKTSSFVACCVALLEQRRSPHASGDRTPGTALPEATGRIRSGL